MSVGRWRSLRAFFAIVFTPLLVAAACGGAAAPAAKASAPPSAAASSSVSASAAPSPTKTPVNIAVGMTNGLANAPVAVAQAKGFFKDEGLNVTFNILTSSPQMEAALASGQVQFTLQGIAASNFNAAARGIDTRAIASQNNVDGYWPLVSRKAEYDNKTITKASDLKGKKIAVNAKGSSTEYFLNAALKTGGLATKDVDMVVIPSFPDMVTGLGTGSIDGAMLIEPNAQSAIQKGFGHRLIDNYLPNATISFVFTDNKWASAHRTAVVGFLKAYRKAMDLLRNDAWRQPGDIYDTIKSFTKMTDDALHSSPSPAWTDGTIDTNSITDMQQYFMSTGALTYSTPITPDKLIDTSYLADAKK